MTKSDDFSDRQLRPPEEVTVTYACDVFDKLAREANTIGTLEAVQLYGEIDELMDELRELDQESRTKEEA